MTETSLDFDDLVPRYGSALRKLAAALVQDAGAAEDAVQDTWTAALVRPPANASSPQGWLTTVLHNVVRRYRRGDRRRRQREAEYVAMAFAEDEELARQREAVRAQHGATQRDGASFPRQPVRPAV